MMGVYDSPKRCAVCGTLGCLAAHASDEPRCVCGARDGEDHHRNCPQWDERAEVGIEIKVGDGEALYSRRGSTQAGFLTVRGTGADILAAILAEVARQDALIGRFPTEATYAQCIEKAAIATVCALRLKAGGAT